MRIQLVGSTGCTAYCGIKKYTIRETSIWPSIPDEQLTVWVWRLILLGDVLRSILGEIMAIIGIFTAITPLTIQHWPPSIFATVRRDITPANRRIWEGLY